MKNQHPKGGVERGGLSTESISKTTPLSLHIVGTRHVGLIPFPVWKAVHDAEIVAVEGGIVLHGINIFSTISGPNGRVPTRQELLQEKRRQDPHRPAELMQQDIDWDISLLKALEDSGKPVITTDPQETLSQQSLRAHLLRFVRVLPAEFHRRLLAQEDVSSLEQDHNLAFFKAAEEQVTREREWARATLRQILIERKTVINRRVGKKESLQDPIEVAILIGSNHLRGFYTEMQLAWKEEQLGELPPFPEDVEETKERPFQRAFLEVTAGIRAGTIFLQKAGDKESVVGLDRELMTRVIFETLAGWDIQQGGEGVRMDTFLAMVNDMPLYDISQLLQSKTFSADVKLAIEKYTPTRRITEDN